MPPGIVGGVTHDSSQPKIKRVFYEGTDVLKEGYCLCYNQDYGAPTAVDQGRLFRVEKPSPTNCNFFAGVATPMAEGRQGPCYVDIILPGSIAKVWSKVNATINATRMTVCAGEYHMYSQGFKGQGSALCRQTLDRSTAGLLFGSLEDGDQSGGVELVTPANGAMTIMVGGVTYFPATAIAGGNATYVLADGIFFDQRKGFICEGAMTTSEIVITVTTEMPVGGYPFTAPAGAFNTFTMNAAAEYLMAQWNGKAWELRGEVGTTV